MNYDLRSMMNYANTLCTMNYYNSASFMRSAFSAVVAAHKDSVCGARVEYRNTAVKTFF